MGKQKDNQKYATNEILQFNGAYLMADLPYGSIFLIDILFGGYGKTTPELITFVKQFVADTGILIDPVYTGKMFFAIYNLAIRNYFKPGSKILAIHSGGIWGILGLKDKF